ncbi:unnamed protein product [Rhizoctonia solani]|uniref:Uncharacterized protein n=1 Tax=Rhizoctonia solani TaxID=456999 RepID=A0A8H2WLQ0_9AGAM|nr:unnamed protein product [Rhizoctonia solani]
MNNPRSMAASWAALLVGGGITFYFVKKDIDQRRKLHHRKPARTTEIKDWYEWVDTSSKPSTSTSDKA